MAWESRIARESVRQAVLAVIMLTLLGASTALAMWLTTSAHPTQLTHELADFEFVLPSNWQQDASQTGTRGDGLPVASFTIGPESRAPTKLTVLPLNNTGWRVPMQAINEARMLLAPTMRSIDDQTLGYGPVSVLQFSSEAPVRIRNGPVVTQKYVLAVATVDGQSYLAFCLTGLDQLQPADKERMSRVTLSLLDQRYTQIDGQEHRIEGVTVRLPKSLLMLEPVRQADAPAENDNASLLITPDASDELYHASKTFFRMHLSVVRTEQLRQQWEQRDIPEAKTARVNKLIEAQLKARYLTVNGVEPPVNAVHILNLGTRQVQVIVLDDARLRGWQREWWATALDDQHVLMLELLADVRAINMANQAAALIVHDVQTPMPGDASPAPSPDSESPTP